MDASASTYIVSQWLFLKLLGVVYGIAFGSLLVQVDGLYGSQGVLPVKDYVGLLHWREKLRLISRLPSLFLFFHCDRFLRFCAAAGLVLALLLVLGLFPAPILLLLWLLYLSFVVVGQDFLCFQWDALLLETGFMAIFFALARPPTTLMVVAWWFFLFRFLFSSGAVKLTSGDPHWRNLTALNFHYQTQPLPNRVAWYAHQLPPALQKLSTLGVFFFELVVPFFIWGPTELRLGAFFLTLFFQGLILLTGNFGFFNILTLVLAVPLLGDDSLGWLAGYLTLPENGESGPVWSAAVSCAFAIFFLLNAFQLALLFWRPRRLLRLVAPLSRWGISSPYGLFAVMTTERYEFVVEGSYNLREWQPYEFRWKPGAVDRVPRQVAPHQPRLDWQMWFAALAPQAIEPWLANLLFRLRDGSKPVLALLKTNPFGDKPPRHLRLVVYRYRFSDRATREVTGRWWLRELVGESQPLG